VLVREILSLGSSKQRLANREGSMSKGIMGAAILDLGDPRETLSS